MDEQVVHKGIDVLPDERLLVSASTLEWTLDATAKTIRRWAEQGLMPKPYKVGKSLRWDADELRKWIASGCEPVEGVHAIRRIEATSDGPGHGSTFRVHLPRCANPAKISAA